MYGDVVLGVDHYLFEEALEDLKQAQRLPLRHRARRRGSGRSWSSSYKAIVAKDTGKPFPRTRKEQLWGAIGAVFGSWETPRAVTYRRLQRHRRRHGHRRHRAGDGVRQHGRRLRHRRRLHPQPVDRREGLLRRVPDQRPGRGRGRRHPHAAAADPRHGRGGGSEPAATRSRTCCRRPSASWSRSSNGSRRTTATCRTSSSRSSRASSSSCRPAAASAPPRRRSRSPSTWRSEGLISEEEAVLRVEPGLARPAPAPDARPQGRAQDHRQGAAGLAGCRLRQGRVLGRRCRAAGQAPARR